MASMSTSSGLVWAGVDGLWLANGSSAPSSTLSVRSRSAPGGLAARALRRQGRASPHRCQAAQTARLAQRVAEVLDHLPVRLEHAVDVRQLRGGQPFDLPSVHVLQPFVVALRHKALIQGQIIDRWH